MRNPLTLFVVRYVCVKPLYTPQDYSPLPFPLCELFAGTRARETRESPTDGGHRTRAGHATQNGSHSFIYRCGFRSDPRAV